MKTLTDIANFKRAKRFLDSLDYVTYEHQGEVKQTDILKKEQDGNKIEVLIYFDAEIEGEISNVKVIDTDGDVVISSERVYNKEDSNYPRGLYISFEYIFDEEIVTSNTNEGV